MKPSINTSGQMIALYASASVNNYGFPIKIKSTEIKKLGYIMDVETPS